MSQAPVLTEPATPAPEIHADHLDGLFRALAGHPQNLIPILQEIQEKYHYLPEAALREVAERLDVPLPQVFHVATFYNCFSLEPVGDHLIQVCLGTACHVRGSPLVLEALLRELKMGAPGTTGDRAFTVRTVRCIGCCGLAPVVRVDQDTYAQLTQARVRGVLRRYSRAAPGEANAPPAERTP